ncbi:hypothetical protein NPX13_g10893 [Xylaria arbuscula]|uniref:Uncharacterized protein n=1 Tax=Xylaria arbuscula TaxID=114810 RepID=A0A9W8THG7_9PEZI|nr:hypothetical protein NPX13_g10893 [Xylaria arbuscula]
MATNLPSTFASAAAGQNSNRDARSGSRGDGRGNASGEWSRPARTMNGTLTFRRTSTTPSSQALNQQNMSEPVSAPDDPSIIAAMPVGSTVVEDAAPRRYSRDDMLSMFSHVQQDLRSHQPDVSAFFVSGWNPGHANGISARGWGKSTDSHVLPQEPDICWDTSASTKPIGLEEMTSEEREAGLPFHPSKQATLLAGRLVPQPTLVCLPLRPRSRPGTRRRETGDTNPFSGGGGLNSPISANRPSRDNGSPWLDRKNTDAKDPSMWEEPEEDLGTRETSAKLPFGAGSRAGTATSATAFGGPSPWQTSSPGGLSGLGSFGNFALPGSTIGEKRPGNPRGESRLAHLIPNNNSDNTGNKLGDTSTNADSSRNWRPRPRTDTDPFGDEGLSGSAVLGGAQDTSPPPLPHSQRPLHSYDTPIKGSASDFGMSGLNLGGHGDHDPTPLSPSETNPYRSPPGDRGEHDELSADKSQGLGGAAP